MNNPFNPTFGDVPEIFLDADSRVTELITTIQNSKFARSFFITGVRGSGKTAFLNACAHKLQKDSACYYINVLNQGNLVQSFTKKLIAETENLVQKAFNNINSVTVNGWGLGISNSDLEYDQILETILKKIKKQKKYVVVAIDEITNSRAVRDFAQVFNELKGEDLPLFVLMTGLPDLVLDLQTDNKLTFLLRSEKLETLPLRLRDVLNSYKNVFNCSIDLASQMAQMTKGYSYAFQLLGFRVFNQSDGRAISEMTIKQVTIEYQMDLFDNAYQKIFTDLSDMDRKYLMAVADNRRFQDVLKILDKDKVYVAQYRRRAIERHLIKPKSYGTVEYTLPYFDKYIKQVQNLDSIYYMGY